MKSRKSVGRKIHDIKEWIVSYLVVLVIPIVICSAFFLYTYLMTWEEIRDSNTAVLQLVASELDQVFNETFLLEYQKGKRICTGRASTECRKTFPLNRCG